MFVKAFEQIIHALLEQIIIIFVHLPLVGDMIIQIIVAHFKLSCNHILFVISLKTKVSIRMDKLITNEKLNPGAASFFDKQATTYSR